ncbi:MAG: hypothetical protein Q8P05_02030 [Candidatus Diapherotrites archaeon]|nr:hypothetical protein [Candidatus Diapherotrites archaeon]
MTGEKFKCTVCGFISETPGEHCGKPLEAVTETPAPAPEAPASNQPPSDENPPMPNLGQ